MKLITKERAQEIFTYEPETGLFKRTKAWGRYREGDPMGRLRKDGYFDIFIDEKRYYLHRLAWLWMTGAFPEHGKMIDHIDRNRSNNRFDNLRVVTPYENQLNRSDRFSVTREHLIGASLTRSGRWGSRIDINKQDIWLGTFDSKEEASNAYWEAKERLMAK